MKIQFFGAAQEVTGSKHLITTNKGKRILLDCGMYQGKGMETDAMNRNLGFDARKIDYVLLSHAHIDHSGLLPYLYKKGFRGSIITTPATRDLCAIMLQDSAHIQELDVKWYNKKQNQRKQPVAAPIYEPEHAEKVMQLFITVAYDRRFQINDDINVRFTNSGHMLGSAVINLEINEDGQKKRIAFTGDIGRPNNNILSEPCSFPQCDYLIAESTYGDRLHPADTDNEEQLLQIVEDTCIRRRGKLIIPSFSIGRTQEIVYVLDKLYDQGRLPENIPVFVDSPLSVNATHIFQLYTDLLNDHVQELMRYDPDPFGFNGLTYITKATDSKRLNNDSKPAIIISASGMLEAGRVKHHVANHIEDPNCTILMVGYCTPTSLGARIQDPELKEVSIFGTTHRIRAQVRKIEGFSGHGDYQEMIDFLSCQDKNQIQKLFLVHGEKNAQQQYAAKLYEAGFQHIEIPTKAEEFDL